MLLNLPEPSGVAVTVGRLEGRSDAPDQLYGIRRRKEEALANRSNVSQLLLQPFVNYNLPAGWYLTSSPIGTVKLGRFSQNTEARTVVMPRWSRCAIAPPLLIGRSEASTGRRDGAGG